MYTFNGFVLSRPLVVDIWYTRGLRDGERGIFFPPLYIDGYCIEKFKMNLEAYRSGYHEGKNGTELLQENQIPPSLH